MEHRYTEKQLEHLNHHFYKEVEDIVNDVAKEQILKGADKYPEPFDPFSWTSQQLLRHILQETRDQQVYAVGLYKVIVRLEAENRYLREELRQLQTYFQLEKTTE